MARSLNRKVGEMTPDKLIAGITPAVHVSAGELRAVAEGGVYKRGTVLAKSAEDNKLVILGTTPDESELLVPDCILCDDTPIGTEDVVAAVYTAGNFNTEALIVKDGYELTENDKDKLRERGLYLSVVLD